MTSCRLKFVNRLLARDVEDAYPMYLAPLCCGAVWRTLTLRHVPRRTAPALCLFS